MKFILLTTLIALLSVFGLEYYNHEPYPPIYQALTKYKVMRFNDANDNNRDTIKIWTSVNKDYYCDVTKGSGPIWVDIQFEDGYVSAAPLYASKDEFADSRGNLGQEGDEIILSGYFFIGTTHFKDNKRVPIESAEINIPCEMNAEYNYQKVIGKVSDIKVPDSGKTIVFDKTGKHESSSNKVTKVRY